MFNLALTFGLDCEPLGALEKMAGLVESAGEKHAVEHPLQMTLGLSDGKRLYAVRYSSEGDSRTLYYSDSMEALRQLNPALTRFSRDARAVVSEPLNEVTNFWIEVPESCALALEEGKVTTHAFEPRSPA
jgi:glutamine amidotransferase